MNKRFISGAQCPQCNAMDKLVIYEKDGRDHFECVACGHIQVRPTVEELQQMSQQAEPVQDHNDKAEVITIVDLKKSKK